MNVNFLAPLFMHSWNCICAFMCCRPQPAIESVKYCILWIFTSLSDTYIHMQFVQWHRRNAKSNDDYGFNFRLVVQLASQPASQPASKHLLINFSTTICPCKRSKHTNLLSIFKIYGLCCAGVSMCMYVLDNISMFIYPYIYMLCFMYYQPLLNIY